MAQLLSSLVAERESNQLRKYERLLTMLLCCFRERMHAHKNHPAFKAAAKMPLLAHHCRRGESFDVMRSDVCSWLIEQPELRQELFNLCKRTGSIVFVDGKWIGAQTYAETQREPND